RETEGRGATEPGCSEGKPSEPRQARQARDEQRGTNGRPTVPSNAAAPRFRTHETITRQDWDRLTGRAQMRRSVRRTSAILLSVAVGLAVEARLVGSPPWIAVSLGAAVLAIILLRAWLNERRNG